MGTPPILSIRGSGVEHFLRGVDEAPVCPSRCRLLSVAVPLRLIDALQLCNPPSAQLQWHGSQTTLGFLRNRREVLIKMVTQELFATIGMAYKFTLDLDKWRSLGNMLERTLVLMKAFSNDGVAAVRKSSTV